MDWIHLSKTKTVRLDFLKSRCVYFQNTLETKVFFNVGKKEVGKQISGKYNFFRKGKEEKQHTIIISKAAFKIKSINQGKRKVIKHKGTIY